MNFNPIIIPNTSICSCNIPIELIFSSLIVINCFGLISLFFSCIVNYYDNKKREMYGWVKNSLKDTLLDNYPLSIGVGVPMFFDIIAIILGLIFWVSTLL